MTPEIWNTYIRMQSDVYGDKVSIPQIDDDIITPIGLSHISIEPKDVLIIGPGGRNEVLSWRKRVKGKVDALTIHELELQTFKDLDINGTVGDIHDLPYGNQIYDVVFAYQVLEHTVSPYIALMECHRVLKSTGFLMISVPSFEGPENGTNETHISCLNLEQWRELLRKTGFNITWEFIEETNSVGSYYYYFNTNLASMLPYHNKVLTNISKLKENL